MSSLDPKVLANSLEEVVWNIKLGAKELVSKIITTAKSSNGEVDQITTKIPILAKGFYKDQVFVGHEPTSFNIKTSENILLEKSNIEISLSSTKVGLLPTSMSYLISYPYGCVEQTTSRFVPVLLANENKELFADFIKNKDLDSMVEKGLSRLDSLQQGDGGWGWWSNGSSDPFITAYVTEYLLKAQSQGYEIPVGMLKRVESFLVRGQYYDRFSEKSTEYSLDQEVVKTYALSLLGHEEGKNIFLKNELNEISSDILPYAVIVNVTNGITNADENGLNKLISLGEAQGAGLYWKAGDFYRFKSIDTSTALTARAILFADPNNIAASKAIHYLTVQRRKDYWSNTFATVQVARAMLDFSKVKKELTANYNYTVKLDDEVLLTGKVSEGAQLVKTIKVPIEKIANDGSVLKIEKEGEGQIYSTVVLNEFHTSLDQMSVDQKIGITREYVSERGYEYGITNGDLVTVNLTVSGINPETPYILIKDDLPAGLIPINENLKNQSNYNSNRSRTYGETKEYTQNGVIIALSRGIYGKNTYSYKARAIATGEFYAPPAKVELMYSPEVYGLSMDEVVSITKDPVSIRENKRLDSIDKDTKDNLEKVSTLFIIVVFISSLGIASYGIVHKEEVSLFLKKLVKKLKK